MGKRHTQLGSVLAATLALVGTAAPARAQSPAFDFDKGNAATEIVIPTAVPLILRTIGHGDAPLILRMTAMTTNSWFDAIAPYHTSAIGVHSRIARRPASESVTHRQRNVAMLYASLRVLSSLMPQFTAEWRAMLSSVGLNPDDNRSDDTPTGIGNRAGNAIVAFRVSDGMNQLGNEGGRKYNLRPYADYLGYQPVNTPYVLRNPGRWQPNILTINNGIFTSQEFVVPQMRVTKAYTFKSPDSFVVPAPYASDPRNEYDYRRQADEVISASANLTDYQKMIAELFDHKFNSLATSGFFATQKFKLPLNETIHYEFLLNFSAFDAAIVTWKEKYRHDAVRPFSAIRHLYKDNQFTAWGGPGKGTVTDMTGKQWRSYLNTANHPEYPSGSSCFCEIHAEVSRIFLGTDELGWSVPVKKGSSFVEPGITPKSDMVLEFPTWTTFVNECKKGRFWGGVHFKAATDAGQKLCKPLGKPSVDFLRAHVSGQGHTPN